MRVVDIIWKMQYFDAYHQQFVSALPFLCADLPTVQDYRTWDNFDVTDSNLKSKFLEASAELVIFGWRIRQEYSTVCAGVDAYIQNKNHNDYQDEINGSN